MTTCTKMADCNICCETFTATARKAIGCAYCGFDACRVCVETYLCSSTHLSHCMQCRNGWSNEFMTTVMTQSFLSKKYKPHREKVLYERECSMLPETQPLAEAEAVRRKVLAELRVLAAQAKVFDSTISALCSKRAKIELSIAQLHPFVTPRDILRIGYDDLAPVLHELGIAKRRRNELSQKMAPLREVVYGSSQETAPRRVFVRRCPMAECRGFLDSKWCCGLCDTRVCGKCHEVLDASQDHECNPNDVLTAKALSKETRPCPSCSTRIFKVDGCDQMWCTQCRTPFSWRTGQVETGTVHNPHFVEFLRRNNGSIPRNPLDVRCGGVPGYHSLSAVMSSLLVDEQTHDFVLHCVRLMTHVQDVEYIKYRIREIDENNRDLRVAFLLKDFDDAAFKTKLQRREKATAKKREIMDVLTMLVNMGAIILQRVEHCTDQHEVGGVVKELSALLHYTDESMKEISKRYACVTPRFTVHKNGVVTIK